MTINSGFSCGTTVAVFLYLICSCAFARLSNRDDAVQPHSSLKGTNYTWAETSIHHATKYFSDGDRALQEEVIPCDILPQSNLENSWKFAHSNGGTGMLVYQNGVLQMERYAPENICALVCRFSFVRTVLVDWLGLFGRRGGSPTRPASLYSMTKTLAGMAALLLQQNNGVSLDDPVSVYISEWANDAERNTITIRQLLSLSSGTMTDLGLIGHLLFRLSTAIRSPIQLGQPFDYGYKPFLVFSRLVEVVTGATDAQLYLQENLFTPLGITSFQLGETIFEDRLTVLSSGAAATLPDIATLGLELLAAATGSPRVFTNTDIVNDMLQPGSNPAYGLSVWLNAAGLDTYGEMTVEPSYPACGTAQGVFHAIGAGGQVLTIVPSQQLVIAKTARLAGGVRFEDMQPFWDALFEGQDCTCHQPRLDQ